MKTRISKIPDAVVLKVPEGDGRSIDQADGKEQNWTRYTNPVPLLLELGAPTHFVERIVGAKSEPERFIRIAEYETSTTAANMKKKKTSNPSETPSESKPSPYIDHLCSAREVLRNDGVLSKLLVTDDIVCWPPPRLLDLIVKCRVEMLRHGDRKDYGNQLQEAYLRHRIDVVGTGIHRLNVDWDSSRNSLTQQKMTPILYDVVKAETIKYEEKSADGGGPAQIDPSSSLPAVSGLENALAMTKKQQKRALEKKQQDESMKSRHGETAKESFQKGLESFSSVLYQKEMLAGLEKDQDLRITMAPSQNILKMYTLEFQKGEYRVFDLIAETVRKRAIAAGQTVSDDLAELAKDGWSMNKTVQQAFKEIIGIGWEQLINLHDFIHTTDAAHLAAECYTDATTMMRCANGAVYSISGFLTYERAGSNMTNSSMMRLLSRNSHNRVRIRNGVYATRVSFNRYFVIHKNLSLVSETVNDDEMSTEKAAGSADDGMDYLFDGNDDAEEDLRSTTIPVRVATAPMTRKDVDSLKALTRQEEEEFEGNFRTSLRDTIEHFGNVKVFFTHVPDVPALKSEVDAFVNKKFLDISKGDSVEESAAPSTSRLGQEEKLRKLEVHEAKAECKFKKHQRLSESTMVTEFAVEHHRHKEAKDPSNFKPKIFVPGQDFVIIHGPRVLENYDPYFEEEETLKSDLEQILLNDSSRSSKEILQNLRAHGTVGRQRREALWDHSLGEAEVVTLLQMLFAENHNKISKYTIREHHQGKTIPDKLLDKCLRKMSHFDKHQGKYVLH